MIMIIVKQEPEMSRAEIHSIHRMKPIKSISFMADSLPPVHECRFLSRGRKTGREEEEEEDSEEARLLAGEGHGAAASGLACGGVLAILRGICSRPPYYRAWRQLPHPILSGRQ